MPAHVAEQVVVGVSTRGYKRSLEPVDEFLRLASDPVVLDDEPSRAPQGLVV